MGSGGISNLTLNNLNISSGLADTEGSYVNHICTATATLLPNTSYDLRITLQGIDYISFYFDFNNDGDFNDPDESDIGYFINVDGIYLIPLIMPETMNINELLRMRIVTSDTPIPGSCHNPTLGQVAVSYTHLTLPTICSV